jgi:peptidoglycan/LPS O-acetylase OafA/YrhL
LAELPTRDYFAPPNLRGEIKPLTGIRGVAAFLVMLYHYATTPTFSGFHLAELRKGYLCVDLFFVLSGFILALRYGDRFKRTLSRSSYAAFLQARIARLYPAYVVITLLYYAKWVFNISGTNATPYRLQDFVANALFVQSWGFPARPIIGDSWSVSVECFAYLAFPLLVFAALERSRIAAPALTATAVGMLIFITCTGYGVIFSMSTIVTSLFFLTSPKHQCVIFLFVVCPIRNIWDKSSECRFFDLRNAARICHKLYRGRHSLRTTASIGRLPLQTPADGQPAGVYFVRSTDCRPRLPHRRSRT